MARKGLITWLSPSPESTEPWFSKELCSFLALENPKPFEITQVHHQKWRKKEEKYLNIHVHIKTWIACKKLPWNLRYMKKSLIRTVPMSNYNFFFKVGKGCSPLPPFFTLLWEMVGRGGSDKTRILVKTINSVWCFPVLFLPPYFLFFFFFLHIYTLNFLLNYHPLKKILAWLIPKVPNASLWLALITINKYIMNNDKINNPFQKFVTIFTPQLKLQISTNASRLLILLD